MRQKIATSEVLIARQLLIEHATLAKKDLFSLIESGHREWDKMRHALERYQDLLTAADALGHTTSIEDRA